VNNLFCSSSQFNGSALFYNTSAHRRIFPEQKPSTGSSATASDFIPLGAYCQAPFFPFFREKFSALSMPIMTSCYDQATRKTSSVQKKHIYISWEINLDFAMHLSRISFLLVENASLEDIQSAKIVLVILPEKPVLNTIYGKIVKEMVQQFGLCLGVGKIKKAGDRP
jgi:hypothetical protein